jgi:hypothetical protein
MPVLEGLNTFVLKVCDGNDTPNVGGITIRGQMSFVYTMNAPL